MRLRQNLTLSQALRENKIVTVEVHEAGRHPAGLVACCFSQEEKMKSSRAFRETVVKCIRAAVSTPPNTWYRQWRRRNKGLPGTHAGYLEQPAEFSGRELIVGGMEIMQEWERPLMRALAQEAAQNQGHVLEVGFGMGISASYLIQSGCSQYSVIEPHGDVLKMAREWADKQSVPVQIIEGFWQDVIDGLGLFDGILFDTYQVLSEDYQDKVYVPFIPKAAAHLRPGGVFTFFSGTSGKLPADHVALLEANFADCRFYEVTGLTPPKDCQYYRDSTMLVPVCKK